MGGRPFKIVRIIARMNIGGPAMHAALLTEGFNDGTFISILVTGTVSKNEGDMLPVARRHHVSPLIIPELGREISWRDDLAALWKLYRLLMRERPDIVHTHTAKAGALGRIAALLACVPIRIHTFHGHVFHHYFNSFKTQVFVFLERVLARFTTVIVAISPAQLTDLADRYRIAAREKFCIIPLGLDLAPLLSVPAKTTNGLQSEDGKGGAVAIGLIGRLVPIKNPLMSVRVFDRLTRLGGVGTDSHLIIAGDGELRPVLEELVTQLDLRGRILCTGWEQDLAALYSHLDLVILTSLNEGTPVVLIEAMAAGLPFVATRVGGVTDLMVGPERVIQGATGRRLFSLFANGALVESQDVEGFTAAVEWLVRDREAMRMMGSEGRKLVKELYTRERLLRDMRALYERCLAG